MEYQKQRCVLCNNSRATMLYITNNVVRCCTCGHVYTKVYDSNLNNLYSDAYYSYNKEKHKINIYSFVIHNIKKIIIKYYYGEIKNIPFIFKKYGKYPFFKQEKNDLNILDIGCGNGDFLTYLNNKKWNKYGIEINKKACDIAKNNKIRIFNSNSIPKDFKNNTFDVIRYWHVLEHLPNPIISLQNSTRLLKKNGLIIIAVPNIDSINSKIFKNNWFDLDPTRHLNHFSVTSMKKLLKNTKLKIVDVRGYDQLNSILNSYRNITNNPLLSTLLFVLTFFPLIIYASLSNSNNYLIIIAKNEN